MSEQQPEAVEPEVIEGQEAIEVEPEAQPFSEDEGGGDPSATDDGDADIDTEPAEGAHDEAEHVEDEA